MIKCKILLLLIPLSTKRKFLMKTWGTAMIFMCCYGLLNAQDEKFYTTSSGELIFSVANIEDNGVEEGAIVRFSAFFHFQVVGNYDLNDRLGVFGGFGLKNIGFIYDEPDTIFRKKYRTYNISVPLGIKIGNIKGMHLYGGYSFEIPINYKEKTFTDEQKTSKFNVWFSSRTPAIMHGVFGGIQFPRGMNLKFQYYLTNFFDKDWTDGTGSQPFQNFDVNVFYISLNFNLFRNKQFTLDDELLVNK